MVEEMVRAAKQHRWNRTLAALAAGTLVGSFLFSSVETGVLAGGLAAFVVWWYESREVWRVQKIQKPWRNE